MFKKTLRSLFALTVTCIFMGSASANSIGFTQDNYFFTQNVTIAYDFSDFAMFGGGFDVIWDTEDLVFVGYTPAELPPDAQVEASPVGSLSAPNVYSGAGIGTFDFLNGMTSSGIVGTFQFIVLGGGGSSNTPCLQSICIVPNAINPFVSLSGQDVTAELFANGISGAGFTADPPPHVPVPAAVWLMLSGLGALFGFSRNK